MVATTQSGSGQTYGVACCDCRDLAAVRRLLGGRKVNMVITSPPYASQRAYDPSSGFEPVRAAATFSAR
jgi:DNA modification methylase